MQKQKPDKNLNLGQTKLLFILFTLGFTFLVFCLSIPRPWLPFDERLFSQETLFPIPSSLNEAFEIIRNFALNCHIESMNTFFSNHLTLRHDPLTWVVIIFLLYLFKANPVPYHLFQLSIHLINTALLWLLLDNLSLVFFKNHVLENKTRYLLISLICLIFAVHSTNVEAVLLATNWNSILAFTVCFSLVLFEVSSLKNSFAKKTFNLSISRSLFVFLIYFFTLILVEQIYTFPLIVFTIVFAVTYSALHNETTNLKEKNKQKTKEMTLSPFTISVRYSLPYFLSVAAFILFFISAKVSLLTSTGNLSTDIQNTSPLYIFLERNLWLTPKIFLHILKLIFFPMTLSPYQSNLTFLTDTLINPYTIFSTALYLIFLILPVMLFLIFRRKSFGFIFILPYAFFFAFFPYSHIITPTYCLSADRYCYCPLFYFSVILFCVAFYFTYFLKIKINKPIITILSVFVIVLSLRTSIRILEWNNPEQFYKSSINIEKNPLYKAQKLLVIADFVGKQGENPGEKYLKQIEMENYLQESLKYLNIALKKFEKLNKKIKNQPVTLKIYGLDYESLISKAAYLTATIKNDNYRESPVDILTFYEPYVKNKIDKLFINQIALYADILARAKKTDEAKQVLEAGYKRFPYSAGVILSLAGIYTEKKELEKAKEFLEKAKAYFPNQRDTLYNLLKYYEAKNDLENQASTLYLIGLRDHSENAFIKASQLYLSQNELLLAKKTIKKLIKLSGENPSSILLTTKYLDLTGQREKILPLLTKAYVQTKTQGKSESPEVKKSILASLISTNLHYGKKENAKEYLTEFEKIKDLNHQDRQLINELKQKIE